MLFGLDTFAASFFNWKHLLPLPIGNMIDNKEVDAICEVRCWPNDKEIQKYHPVSKTISGK